MTTADLMREHHFRVMDLVYSLIFATSPGGEAPSAVPPHPALGVPSTPTLPDPVRVGPMHQMGSPRENGVSSAECCGAGGWGQLEDGKYASRVASFDGTGGEGAPLPRLLPVPKPS